jgi:hypothetical protein
MGLLQLHFLDIEIERKSTAEPEGQRWWDSYEISAGDVIKSITLFLFGNRFAHLSVVQNLASSLEADGWGHHTVVFVSLVTNPSAPHNRLKQNKSGRV